MARGHRNTFDITHPHYRILKNYLHTLLHEKIFRRVRDRYVERMRTKKKEEKKERNRLIDSMFTSKFGSPFVVEYSKKFNPKYPVDIDVDRKILTIYQFHNVFRRPKQKKTLIEDILIRFEIAYSLSEGDVEKLRQYFLDEIERW